jgi:hypothetical protein
MVLLLLELGVLLDPSQPAGEPAYATLLQCDQQAESWAGVDKMNGGATTYCAPSWTTALDDSLFSLPICCHPSSMIRNRGGVPPSAKLQQQSKKFQNVSEITNTTSLSK